MSRSTFAGRRRPGVSEVTDRLPQDIQVVTGAEVEHWAFDGDAPRAVAFPDGPEQAAAILRTATEHRWSVAPAGAGTWLAGGGVTRIPDLVLSTQRLDRIRVYEPGDMTLTGGAGLSLQELAETTRAHGQRLALDPPGSATGTLGATAATGSAGPLRASHGTPRDLVLGATFVTGDGRVLELGGRVVKNVAGFDLLKLAVGSWGTLGLLTEVTVRLHPLPGKDVTLVYVGEAEAMLRTARALATAPVAPDSLELLDPGWAAAAEITPGDEAAVLARVIGLERAVDESAKILEKAAGRTTAARVGPESEQLMERVNQAGSGRVELRASGLPSRLRATMAVCRSSLQAVRPRMAAHATEGIVRVSIDRAEVVDRAPDLGRELETLRSQLEAMGGSLTVINAPVQVARSIPTWGSAGGATALLAGLKRTFDPAAVLWPGRLSGEAG